MENEQILRLLKLNAKLLELHDENQFKVRAYQSAVFHLDKTSVQLDSLSLAQLEQLPNVGKSIASVIYEISTQNAFKELHKLLEITPKGVVEMLEIKGIGPKKIRLIWKELAIESLDALKTACKEDKIAKLKGFGEKTQEEILEFLAFKEASKGKFYYADVETIAYELEKSLQSLLPDHKIAISGAIRRKLEIGEELLYIIGAENNDAVFQKLSEMPGLEKNDQKSSPFIWRGNVKDTEINVTIKVYQAAEFISQVYIHSAGKPHLQAEAFEGKSVFTILKSNQFTTEQAFFEKLGWQYIEPELREGYFEIEAAKTHTLPELVKDTDLKGIFHNHSTYSDGKHTLEQMAVYCKELGYEYLGISDHSKTAAYANGLREDAIKKQHQEIDELNKKLFPFKIFKGIESDILGDGSLDYEEDVLQSFDFIVASIHANLKMDIDKATQRLIKAIENPYTTMLGHPTGRLLLRRQGYPIDFEKVIDACAANGVIIEINANPWRLDLDWRWVNYAISKNVMLSINPDAHEMEGYQDMHFGILTGRKGGLTKEFTFNSKPLNEIEKYLLSRKK